MDINNQADKIHRQKIIEDGLANLDVSETKFVVLIHVDDKGTHGQILGTTNSLELRGVASLAEDLIIQLAQGWKPQRRA